MKVRKPGNVIISLIAVLLFNMVMPALASIVSPDDKILICSQNGFEWVSVDQKEEAYLVLAQQLNLDIEQLFPEVKDSSKSTTPPHGKCVLCFFEQQDLATLPSHQFSVDVIAANPIVYSFVSVHFYTLGEYKRPHSRAPPVFS